MSHKTIHVDDFKIEDSDRVFKYQKQLTDKLDDSIKPFNQEIINEIVLWKVNRYAEIDEITLTLINAIDTKTNKIDIEQTKQVLTALLKTQGIQLPMASTILRFKNPKIYQIIDQRVYRIIYSDKTYKSKTYLNDKVINEQVDLYLNYLTDLREISMKLEIDFEQADRVLYEADKRINGDIPLENYGKRKKTERI